MKRALVIGGNAFFGKFIVKSLLEKGLVVTLLNRGNRDDGFGDKVTRIKCDRNDSTSLKKALDEHEFDIVFDQVCFEYEQAKVLCELLRDKASKIIFTSTVSVYDYGADIKEDFFDPKNYVLKKSISVTDNYGEAKRQAEYAFTKYWLKELVIVRLPIVLGRDDHSGRLKFHIDKIQKGEPIHFPNIDARMSFVSRDFAGEVISHVGVGDFTGILNVSDIPSIKLRAFVNAIESAIGKKASLSVKGDGEVSPYGIQSDWFINCQKLKSLGFHQQEEWLKPLIKELSHKD